MGTLADLAARAAALDRADALEGLRVRFALPRSAAGTTNAPKKSRKLAKKSPCMRP